METDLIYLTWTAVLALAQIILTACARTLETGLPYNTGPRDQPSPVPPGKIAGRLHRAQNNLLETFPIFAALILIAHVGGHANSKTALGAELYFWGRLAYVPLYAFGLPYIRTAVWVVSFYGMLQIIEAIF